MAEKNVTIRVPSTILARLLKATNKAKNPYAPSVTQILLRGTELALKEVEGK